MTYWIIISDSKLKSELESKGVVFGEKKRNLCMYKGCKIPEDVKEFIEPYFQTAECMYGPEK